MKKFTLLIFCVSLFASVLADDSYAVQDLEPQMQQRYLAYKQTRKNDPAALPFDLASSEKRMGGVSAASVAYLLTGIDFGILVKQLSNIHEWCEFIPLHLNIKACVAIERGEKQYLQFYAGVKGYLNPQQASLLELSFNTDSNVKLFVADLFAASGPYRSTDVSFNIRAMKVDEGIYLEFDLSSVPGVAAQLAKIYLATVGRNKIGFSKTGKSWTGKTKYVGGQRGATERNIVRYLLSIETYFETLDLSEEQRFDARIERWFDATQNYKQQLYEMDKLTYLSTKKRERRNQIILRNAIASNTTPIYEAEIDKAQ